MAQKRRRWLTALGLFLATALGGVIAYLAARRRRKEKPSPEEASVSDLLSRLRQEAADRESQVQRRPRFHFPRLGRRHKAPATPPAAAEVAPDLPTDRPGDS